MHRLFICALQLNWDNRFGQPVVPLDLFAGVQAVVDEYFCMVQPPSRCRRDFRAGPNFALKYIVGVRIVDGNIVFCSSWYPGSYADITCLRHCDLLHRLTSGELLLADLAFVGEDRVLHKIKRRRRGVSLTEDQRFYNFVISSFRAIVERTLSRLNVFQCLAQRWRQDIQEHDIIFQLLCRLVNIDLQYRPSAAYLQEL